MLFLLGCKQEPLGESQGVEIANAMIERYLASGTLDERFHNLSEPKTTYQDRGDLEDYFFMVEYVDSKSKAVIVVIVEPDGSAELTYDAGE